jgi:hypothetical protein
MRNSPRRSRVGLAPIMLIKKAQSRVRNLTLSEIGTVYDFCRYEHDTNTSKCCRYNGLFVTNKANRYRFKVF